MKGISMKKFIKTVGLLAFASVVVLFASWLTVYLFNHAPLFMQIGRALGISALTPADCCLGFLAYLFLGCVWKIYSSIIEAIADL